MNPPEDNLNRIQPIGAAELYQAAVHRFFADQESLSAAQDSIIRFKEEIRRLEDDLSRELVRPRQILVIGGAGYIGSVLARHLLQRGYRVRVLDVLLYENEGTLADFVNEPGFEFIEGDFLHQATLHRSLQDVTDVVLLAALVGDPICKQYPEQARDINFHGAVGVIEALKNHPINKLVFTSTCSNYGIFQGEAPADEEAPLQPMSLYAETKVKVEQHILDRKGKLDYSPTVLRLATVFGTGYRTRFDLTINHFTRDLALGRELVVFDHTTWRPYCHVEDIAQAITRVLEYPREKVEFQVFNVGDNQQNYSKEQIVDLIRQSVPDANVQYREGGNDPRDYQVDFRKIQRELNFTPQHSASSCVAELVEALKAGRFDDVEDRQTFYGNYRIPAFDQSDDRKQA